MRAVEDELERHGLAVLERGTTGKSHQYVEFHYLGGIRRFIFAFSPHSSATDYIRQGIRRRLRECAGQGPTVSRRTT